MSLIQFTEKGLYCAKGDFYIDPWRPVDRAIITHAHSDHARPGSKRYLSHHLSKGMLQQRLGTISLQTIGWNEPLAIHGVKVSLHPAGHIIGSSMVRVAYKDEVWLITGDYKLEDDGLSGAWEPVLCTHMVTECTFGLPVYTWQPQQDLYRQMQQWTLENQSNKQCTVFFAYSLGKAQRIMHALAPLQIPMYAHGAVYNANEALQSNGIALPQVKHIDAHTTKKELASAIIIAPPSAVGTPWLRRLGDRQEAACSGWMQVRGNRRRQHVDKGFVLSDHADWPSLLQAVEACNPTHAYTTHGFTESFSRYLREEKKLWSEAVKTQFGTEEDDQHITESDKTAAI